MRSASLVLPFLLLLLGAAAKADTVDFSLAPEMKDGALQALDVEVRYALTSTGVSDFAWAPGWENERTLWQWTRDLKVEGATAIDHPSGGLWRIHGEPGARITVRYRVVSAYDHDPTADDSSQPKPIVRPSWFYSAGYAVFGVPRERLDDPATFHWNGGASSLHFASDLERLAIVPGRVSDIRQSTLLGDRKLIVSGDLTGADRVRVAAIAGDYGFDFPAFDSLTRQTIHEERRFFGEDDRAPFLVAVSSIAPGRVVQQAYSGTGLGASFALWLDHHADLDQMRWLIAHEYFHTWNPGRLGGLGTNDSTAPIAWFSEGFTDYYARALMVRSGAITLKAFVELWNSTLRNYAASPVRTAPNTRIATEFHTDPQVGDLAYQRGALLAALWNARLRARTHGRIGLDDVIRAQYAWIKEHVPVSEGAAPESAPELFVRLARTRFGLDLRSDIRRFVVQGDQIDLPENAFGPCVRVSEVQRPAFDRGFDVEATIKADNVVRGVRPGSPAFLAGLRDGMRIIGRDGGEPGNSDVPYVLRVDDHGTVRVIRYQPIGEQMVTRQELTLIPDRNPESCAKSLSGL